MTRVPAVGRLTAVAAIVVAVSVGCTSTVTGAAVRDANAVPTNVAPLTEAQLDDVLLEVGQLNDITGASGLKVVIDRAEMSDNAESVSDPDCLGSVYGAEEWVYSASAWSAVRDQVAREPVDNDHWVEQTLVLYETPEQAAGFVGDSTVAWQDCGGFSVAVDDDTSSSIWVIDDVVEVGGIVTQVIAQEDSEGWQCLHAMTSVSNLMVEAMACAFGISDEAVAMVRSLVANAAGE